MVESQILLRIGSELPGAMAQAQKSGKGSAGGKGAAPKGKKGSSAGKKVEDEREETLQAVVGAFFQSSFYAAREWLSVNGGLGIFADKG